MSRKLWVVGLFVAATTVLGCQGEGSLPSEPANDLGLATVEPNPASIELAIKDCLQNGGPENSFLKRFRDIKAKVDRNKFGVAQGMAELFIDDLLINLDAGLLTCSPDKTTELAAALLVYVHSASEEDLENLAAAQAAGDRGAAEICDLEAGCEVVADNTCRGIDIPPQTENTGNHLITVFPIDENPFFEVFPGYNSYPHWADVSISGVENLNPPAVVGVFVVEPPDPNAPPNATVEARLRIGHKFFNPDFNEGEGRFEVEILPLDDAPFIGCEDGDVASLEGWQGWLNLAMSPVGRLFMVTPLHADPGKLGGAFSPSGSPIGAVDPDSDTETTLTLDPPHPATIADGEDVTATADVEVVTLAQPPLLSESPSVDFVVDEGTEAEQTLTEPLDENGEAELVLTCGEEPVILTSLALAQATGTIEEGSHTIVARYTGTDSSAPSESDVQTVECEGPPAASVRVSGFDGTRSRAPLDGGTGFDGTSTLVDALLDAENFGADGTVSCTVDIEPLVATIAPGSLVDESGNLQVEVFFAGLTATTLTSAEATELAAFLNAGGVVYLSGNSAENEGPGYNPLFDALDVADVYHTTVTGDNGETSDPPDTTPLTNGPFGTVGPLSSSIFRVLLPATTTGLATGNSSESYIVAEGAFESGYLSWMGDPLYFNLFTDVDQDNLKYFLNLFARGCGGPVIL